MDKIEKCTRLLHAFMSKDKSTIEEMQSFIGTLNTACSVILQVVQSSDISKYITIGKVCKGGICIWLAFSERYSGKTMFLDENFLSNNTLQLHTDAAHLKGFAGIYKNQWFMVVSPRTGRIWIIWHWCFTK